MTKNLNELNTTGIATKEEVDQWKTTHVPGDYMPPEIKKGIMRQAIKQLKKTQQWIAELKNEGIIK